jgi:hypothetical protein
MSPATTATDSNTSMIHLLRLGCIAPVPRHHAVALRPDLTLRAHRDSRTFLVHDLTRTDGRYQLKSTGLDSLDDMQREDASPTRLALDVRMHLADRLHAADDAVALGCQNTRTSSDEAMKR